VVGLDATVAAGWFGLELVAFQVTGGPKMPRRQARAVDNTIDKLGLNQHQCCDTRQEYVNSYLNGAITLAWLERRAPFVASELRRQGRLRGGDR
jgi:hypothetical protein